MNNESPKKTPAAAEQPNLSTQMEKALKVAAIEAAFDRGEIDAAEKELRIKFILGSKEEGGA